MERRNSFQHNDEAVISTNDDASESKKFAVHVGYWKDEYIGFFVKNAERKAPEINRGYFARVNGIQSCIDKFLQVRNWLFKLARVFNLISAVNLSIILVFAMLLQRTGDKCQIINLGCGFDTLYWRLRDAGHMITNFIELDFPTVTSRKCYYIKRNKHLLSKIHVEGTDFGPVGAILLKAPDIATNCLIEHYYRW